MFKSVHREKPESSRNVSGTMATNTIADVVQESKEAFFVALRRKKVAKAEEVKVDEGEDTAEF